MRFIESHCERSAAISSRLFYVLGNSYSLLYSGVRRLPHLTDCQARNDTVSNLLGKLLGYFGAGVIWVVLVHNLKVDAEFLCNLALIF